MAQKLHSNDSPGRVANVSNRHLRLCTQAPGTGPLVSDISSYVEALVKMIMNQDTAEKAEQSAYDLVKFCDNELDTLVAKVSSRAKEHDKESVGARTWELLFPGALDVSSITGTNMFKEPVIVEQLAQRIEGLGADNPLGPLAAELRTKIEQAKARIAEYEEKVRLTAAAKAETEIAKLRVVRQYEANIMQAITLFGRSMANRFFPEIRSGGSGETGTEPSANN
jgi:hypothetical protein